MGSETLESYRPSNETLSLAYLATARLIYGERSDMYLNAMGNALMIELWPESIAEFRCEFGSLTNFYSCFGQDVISILEKLLAGATPLEIAKFSPRVGDNSRIKMVIFDPPVHE